MLVPQAQLAKTCCRAQSCRDTHPFGESELRGWSPPATAAWIIGAAPSSKISKLSLRQGVQRSFRPSVQNVHDSFKCPCSGRELTDAEASTRDKLNPSRQVSSTASKANDDPTAAACCCNCCSGRTRDRCHCALSCVRRATAPINSALACKTGRGLSPLLNGRI